MDEHSRRWAYINRTPGIQSYGFEVRGTYYSLGTPQLVLGVYRKDGELQRNAIYIPANDADIDRLCHELKRAIAGPLGRLAMDAELSTTTVMETET